MPQPLSGVRANTKLILRWLLIIVPISFPQGSVWKDTVYKRRVSKHTSSR